MALLQVASLPSSFSKMLPLQRKLSVAATKSFNLPCPIQCCKQVSTQTSLLRRSANFEPPIWSYDCVQSLSTGGYKGEPYTEQSRVLKEQVGMMLCKEVVNQVDQLELIDVLQRLGVAYHFDNEIKNILDTVYSTIGIIKNKKDLHTTALEFRLLRQYGYNLSTNVFDSFQDEMGNFKKCEEYNDVDGMLSLHEASFLSFEGEIILDKARDFTTKFLTEYVSKNRDNHISLLISHALEFPLHWRLPRWEHQWFINVYKTSPNMSPALLQFAKLDFNMVQAIHQEELKYTSEWWKRVGLAEKFDFARDRLIESFVWSVGMNFKPGFEYFREVITKAIQLITVIDDIYDVHGTLEELELFTDAFDRWDLNAIDSLPEYMKICFLALYNFVNEMAFEALKKNGYNIIPYLKKVWTDLCKAYFKEAKWYYSGYKPSLEEYMENASISITAPVIIIHAFFSIPNPYRKEDLAYLEGYPALIRSSGMIFRLANDLGSSRRENETGDVPKSIECYMNETGASEAEAHEHVKSIILTMWKKMNEQVHENSSNFPQNVTDIAVNLVRMALYCYQYGDGFTAQDPETKSRIFSLIIEPIPSSKPSPTLQI